MQQYKGEFYYPELANKKVYGILKIDDDNNIELELFESLNDIFKPYQNYETTIFGNLLNGQKATLFYCSSTINVIFGVSQTEKFIAKFLLIGTHVLSDSELLFNEITIDINHLHEWLGITGANLKIQDGFKDLTFQYNTPNDIKFAINHDLNGAFLFKPKYPLHSQNFKMEEDVYFSISSNDAKSLITMLSYIREFRKLLSIFIGSKTIINQIALCSPNEKQEIYFYFNDQDDNIVKSTISDFPVKYDDVKDIFPDLLRKWYKAKQEDLIPISNILLESLKQRTLFDENHFLMAFQGVEAFHRRFIQDTANLKTAHKDYMKTILAFIDNTELKSKLNNQLAFAYEMTAKQRFKEIFSQLVIIMPYITTEKQELWAKEMVDSRNYLTHFDPSGLKNKASHSKLKHYTELLKATLIFLIMSHIGIPQELLKGIAKSYQQSLTYLNK